MAPEPAGFTDLFSHNTSSIMSVASSTPGGSDRYTAAPAPAPPAAPPAPQGNNGRSLGRGGGLRSRRNSGGRAGVATGNGYRGEDMGHEDGAMPPPVPRSGLRGVRGDGGAPGVNGAGVLHEWARGGGMEEVERRVGAGLDSDDAATTCVESPEGARTVGSGSGSGSLGSASKRKRVSDDDREVVVGEEAEDVEDVEEREQAWAELAAERNR